MRHEIRIKQGAALILSLTFCEEGQPVDLSTVTLSSMVRDAQDCLVATVSVSKGAAIGAASIQVPAPDNPLDPGTTGWPLGMLRCDIKAIIGGLPVLSETFPIHVGRAVTR